MARKKLLARMASLEASQASTIDPNSLKVDSLERKSRKWSQVHSYSYSQSLTGCVQQLQQMQKYTKLIVGAQGFDSVDPDLYEDTTKSRSAKARESREGYQIR